MATSQTSLKNCYSASSSSFPLLLPPPNLPLPHSSAPWSTTDRILCLLNQTFRMLSHSISVDDEQPFGRGGKDDSSAGRSDGLIQKLLDHIRAVAEHSSSVSCLPGTMEVSLLKNPLSVCALLCLTLLHLYACMYAVFLLESKREHVLTYWPRLLDIYSLLPAITMTIFDVFAFNLGT